MHLLAFVFTAVNTVHYRLQTAHNHTGGTTATVTSLQEISKYIQLQTTTFIMCVKQTALQI